VAENVCTENYLGGLLVRFAAMSVVVEQGGELYSLIVDQVGEVLPLPFANVCPNPPTLDPLWRDVSLSVYREEDRLVVMLDVERLLNIG
jgi:purine-binding chemotaxis protein CheW